MLKAKKLLSALLAASLVLSSFVFATFTVSAATTREVTLIEGNSNWRYDDSDTDLYTPKFYTSAYNDSAWKTGKAPLGYPASDNNSTFGAISSGTLVSSRSNPNAIITYYFRNEFEVKSLDGMTGLVATVGIDDGYVIYINGIEVNRAYINEGTVTNTTTANYVNEPSSVQGTVTVDLIGGKNLLQTGENTIAVSVHNRDNTSSDIYFDMKLVATYESFADQKGAKDYTITNPYASVNWETFGQYKADFHAHSTNSDGASLLYNMVEKHYELDFDILAMTDHNYTNIAWDKAAKGPMATDRMNTIIDGTAGKASGLTDGGAVPTSFGNARGRGMTMIQYSNEQSMGDHVNTFFVDYNNNGSFVGTTNNGFSKMEYSIKYAHDNGGISHVNHPGRYTGSAGNYGDSGAAIANNPAKYMPYVEMFNKYSTCVGMEIINKKDGDSAADRILWDNILKNTLSQENPRNVWGFSNDDTHSLAATGFSYNWMLMPANTVANTRASMENGTFYAVAKVSVRELGSGFTAVGEPPRITKIVTDNDSDTIKIEGYDYTTIEWIADGKIIATGEALDLNKYEDKIGSYVRAQLKGKGGIAFTQAFPLKATLLNSTANIKGDDFGVVELNQEVKYTVSMKDLINTNAIMAVIEYDDNALEFVSASSKLSNTIFQNAKAENGKVTVIIGTSDIKNISDETDVVELVFKVRENAAAGNTKVKLQSFSIAQNDGTTAADKEASLGNSEKQTEIYSYQVASDLTGDSRVTLADLSIALVNYGKSGAGDINRDGIVDTLDYIYIVGYIA